MIIELSEAELIILRAGLRARRNVLIEQTYGDDRFWDDWLDAEIDRTRRMYDRLVRE
jgi:hypothetical protein